MHRHDPVFRVASQLFRHLNRSGPALDAGWNGRVHDLLARQSTLTGLLRRIALAERRGWNLAAGRLRHAVPYDARSVINSCDDLLRTSVPHPRATVALPTLIDELRQLHQEFEHVDLSQRGTIIVHSQPIELEGIRLGRFAVQLHFHRLHERTGSGCFDCVALDPNPASRSEDTTHPHVQGNALCAGDASTPIANALRDGRLCDAFVLIHSVLQTYNPASPFISLDGWNGVACSDCGYATDPDSLYFCEGCENDLCEECISSCDVCGTSRCRDCMERDTVSDLRMCRGCQRRCGQCRRIVDADSFDSDTSLCPECLEEQQEAERLEAEERESEPNNPSPEIDHEPVPTPVSTTVPAVPVTTAAPAAADTAEPVPTAA